MSKKKETVRVDESGPPPEVMAQQIIAESAQPAAPAAQNAQEGPPVARRRGRPPGSGKKGPRDYKAERAARAARAGAPATAGGAEAVIADLQTRAAPLAVQIHRIANPIIRRWTPDDPYTEEEAMQVACAIIPVSDKHSDKVGAAGPEIGLAIIVGMQLLGRYLAVAERERARKEHERGLPVGDIPQATVVPNQNHNPAQVPSDEIAPPGDPRWKNFVQNPK